MDLENIVIFFTEEAPCDTIIKNEIEYERINKIVIPELLKEIYTILGGKLK